MNHPRVKETILDLWGKGWTIGQIAGKLNKSIFYVFHKLKIYGKINPNL